jgi:hypothetical protein
VTRDDETPGPRLQSPDVLGAGEPGGVVASQPALSDAGGVVLEDVEVVAGEDVGAVLGQVDLETDEAGGVAGKVVEGQALAEVHGPLVERPPVEVEPVLSYV